MYEYQRAKIGEKKKVPSFTDRVISKDEVWNDFGKERINIPVGRLENNKLKKDNREKRIKTLFFIIIRGKSEREKKVWRAFLGRNIYRSRYISIYFCRKKTRRFMMPSKLLTLR